ncbi:MAG: hypothetical protein COA79_26280 [Planctomycetota bacterium]|nr:MAG: hypothetical protein COA79_26280 [Planctomycetota bacterium]
MKFRVFVKPISILTVILLFFALYFICKTSFGIIDYFKLLAQDDLIALVKTNDLEIAHKRILVQNYINELLGVEVFIIENISNLIYVFLVMCFLNIVFSLMVLKNYINGSGSGIISIFSRNRINPFTFIVAVGNGFVIGGLYILYEIKFNTGDDFNESAILLHSDKIKIKLQNADFFGESIVKISDLIRDSKVLIDGKMLFLLIVFFLLSSIITINIFLFYTYFKTKVHDAEPISLKNILHPLVVCGFILVLLLGSFAHLMYGSCQTSRYHYMCQMYWMEKNLPEWMKSDKNLFYRIKKVPQAILRYDDYSGIWRTWHRNWNIKSRFGYLRGNRHGWNDSFWDNGIKRVSCFYVEGKMQGMKKHWYPNEKKMYVGNYLNSFPEGKHEEWYDNGERRSVEEYHQRKLLSKVNWNPDGTLRSKEYYDSKGNFQKRELFEKGKLVKTEVEE